jgi:hypothetical protein
MTQLYCPRRSGDLSSSLARPASLRARLIGLKKSLIDGRSDAGSGFLAPKKLGGVDTLEAGGVGLIGLGLDAALVEFPVGVNDMGLNSRAFALNFVDNAEVGVGTPLLCALVISVVLMAGPVGGRRCSGIGTGEGTPGKGVPTLFWS